MNDQAEEARCNAIMCKENLYNKADTRKWLLKHHPDKGGSGRFIGEVTECMADKKFCSVPAVVTKNNTRSKRRNNTSSKSERKSEFEKIFKKVKRHSSTRENKPVEEHEPAYKPNTRKLECLRQISNWSKMLPENRFDKKQFNPAKTDALIPIASPKLEALLQNIKALDENDKIMHGKTFKHFIFSDIKLFGYGAKIISAGLIAKGWNLVVKPTMRKTYRGNMKPDIAIDLPKGQKGDNFAILCSTPLWRAPFSLQFKKNVLSMFNKRPDNIYGENCRIIVLDSGFKEGVDLFDIKYVHLFEPLITSADMTQALGRATRLCGQKGLDFIPNKGWPLQVFKYSQNIPEALHDTLKAKNLFDIALELKGLDTRLHKITKAINDVSILSAVDQPLTEEIHKSGILPHIKVVISKEKEEEDVDLVSTSESIEIDDPILRPNLQSVKTRSKILNIIKNVQEPESITDISSDPCEPVVPPDCYKQLALVPFSPNRMSPEKIVPKFIMDTNMLVIRKPTKVKKTYLKNGKMSWFSLRQHIISQFDNMKWDKQEVINKCGSKGGSKSRTNKKIVTPKTKKTQTRKKNVSWGLKLVDYTPTQSFLSSYFTVQSPIKGMLLWHSVGTGKTCSAIAVASRQWEPAGYTILWVTRHTLKGDIWKNMFDQVCHAEISKEVKEGKITANDVEMRMHKMQQQWLPPMSYRQFSNLVQAKNPLYNLLVSRNGKKDPLRKTFIIIDEAHKLYASDFKGAEKPDVGAFKKALENSYEVSGRDSARVLLMTATPYNETPMELMNLLNLCRPKSEQLPNELPSFIEKYMDADGGFTKEGLKKYMDDIAGHISYLNRESDPSQFAQPVFADVIVPISGFENDGRDDELNKNINLLVEEENGLSKTIEYIDNQIKLINTTEEGKLKECNEMYERVKDVKMCQKRVSDTYKEAWKLENKNMKEAKKRIVNTQKQREKLIKSHSRDTKRMRKMSMSQEIMLAERCEIGV
jgi:superfamily II DNA or RNA helicase